MILGLYIDAVDLSGRRWICQISAGCNKSHSQKDDPQQLSHKLLESYAAQRQHAMAQNYQSITFPETTD
jgi:hypothetical protein